MSVVELLTPQQYHVLLVPSDLCAKPEGCCHIIQSSFEMQNICMFL